MSRKVIPVTIQREPECATPAEVDHHELALAALEAGDLDTFLDVIKKLANKGKELAKKGKNQLVKTKNAIVKKIHHMTRPGEEETEEEAVPGANYVDTDEPFDVIFSDLAQEFEKFSIILDKLHKHLADAHLVTPLPPQEVLQESRPLAAQFVQMRIPIQPYWPNGC